VGQSEIQNPEIAAVGPCNVAPPRKLWIVAATSAALIAQAVGYVLRDTRQASDLAYYAATIGCAGLIWLLVRGRAE